MKLNAPYVPPHYPEDGPKDIAVVPDPKLAKLCAERCVFGRKDVETYDYQTVVFNINLVTGQMLGVLATVGWCFILQSRGIVEKEKLPYSY